MADCTHATKIAHTAFARFNRCSIRSYVNFHPFPSQARRRRRRRDGSATWIGEGREGGEKENGNKSERGRVEKVNYYLRASFNICSR